MRGERMVDLCREYGISRKTGSKFKERFDQLGVAGRNVVLVVGAWRGRRLRGVTSPARVITRSIAACDGA